jgi:TRAP-type C4-dicarboxylate transport system substrate-binding protein
MRHLKIALVAAFLLCFVMALSIRTTKPIEAPVHFVMELPINRENDNLDALMRDELFALLHERSRGRLVGVSANGPVGVSESEIAESIQAGTLDCAMVSDEGIDSVTGNLGWALLPYMITSYEMADSHYHNGWIYDELSNYMRDAGIIRVASCEMGLRVIGTNKRVIEGKEDFKGLRLRVAHVPNLIRFFELLEARPIAISHAETFSAFESDKIEGLISHFTSLGVLDYISYIFKIRHQYNGGSIVVSEKFWNRLTDGDKELFIECARIVGDNHKQNKRRAEEELEKKLAQSGKYVITEVSPEMEALLRKVASRVWKEYESVYAPRMMEKVIRTFGYPDAD